MSHEFMLIERVIVSENKKCLIAEMHISQINDLLFN